MKISLFALCSVALIAAIGGCHHDKAAATTTPQPTKETPAATDQKAVQQVTPDQQVSPNLALSGDLVKLCAITPATTANPSFDYNKEELTPEDRNVLGQLATCMMTGPLKGKAVSLIGRADPRGTEEYNLGLGSRRASSVSTFLTHLGVAAPQLAVTTRGALDATGADEAGWSKDRRVDIQLKVD